MLNIVDLLFILSDQRRWFLYNINLQRLSTYTCTDWYRCTLWSSSCCFTNNFVTRLHLKHKFILVVTRSSLWPILSFQKTCLTREQKVLGLTACAQRVLELTFARWWPTHSGPTLPVLDQWSFACWDSNLHQSSWMAHFFFDFFFLIVKHN